jgi:integrase
MGKLSATKVKNAKPETKNYKLGDGGGLYLLVTQKGRYWRYDYRYLNKRKTLALGVYPEVSLKEAREKHSEARKLLADGIDPSLHRKLIKTARIASAKNSFEKLAWEWSGRQNWTEGHRRTVRGRLNNNILPWIGDRPVNEITAQDVLTVCRRVESRGAIETAHRVKTICSQVFRYCVAMGLVESDPCRDLAGALTPVSPKHMATILEPKKIGELLRAMDAYKGHQITRAALQLAPLTFVRPGELRHAEWNEFDIERALWRIPPKKMKMRQPHMVPLSRQSLEIIRDIRPLTGGGRYLFPSIRSGERCMSENTVNGALRRLGYEKAEITGHGFRSMASTRLHEMGWPSHLIERQLAHREGNTVKAAYNHAEYLSERIKMMQNWADYLDQLRLDTEEGSASSNPVIPMPAKN